MPFDLANSILSSEYNLSSTAPRGPQNSIAQKINHMVTADNDLARKSNAYPTFYPAKRTEEERVGTLQGFEVPDLERSYDEHNKPDLSGKSNPNRMQRISQKIPAKVKLRSEWQNM